MLIYPGLFFAAVLIAALWAFRSPHSSIEAVPISRYFYKLASNWVAWATGVLIALIPALDYLASALPAFNDIQGLHQLTESTTYKVSVVLFVSVVLPLARAWRQGKLHKPDTQGDLK